GAPPDTRAKGGRAAPPPGSVEPLPNAAFVIAYSDGGYTTNLPLADVLNNQAFVAWEHDGRPPAPEQRGRPPPHPAARRRPQQPALRRLGVRRPTARPRARRPGPPRRPGPLLLEE